MHEPVWKHHWLREPKERVRELLPDEGDRIDAAMRPDYEPLFDFVRATGLRQKECVKLRWSEVNWQTRQIVKDGKGDETVTVPITDTVRRILWPLRGHHPEFVFTYVACRTRDDHVRGQRYPLTLNAPRPDGGERARPRVYPIFAFMTSAMTSARSFCARPETSSLCSAH